MQLQQTDRYNWGIARNALAIAKNNIKHQKAAWNTKVRVLGVELRKRAITSPPGSNEWITTKNDPINADLAAVVTTNMISDSQLNTIRSIIITDGWEIEDEYKIQDVNARYIQHGLVVFR